LTTLSDDVDERLVEEHARSYFYISSGLNIPISVSHILVHHNRYELHVEQYAIDTRLHTI